MAWWALWRTGTKPGYPRIFAAAAILAVIVLTNWVSVLAWLLPALLLLVAALSEPGFRFRRPLAAAALAYALACFWLTPSAVEAVPPRSESGLEDRQRDLSGQAAILEASA